MDTIASLRQELQERKGDWPNLCQVTGLSYWWLTKFAQGRIREPGLSKIERLQQYFRERPLPPAEDAPEPHRPGAAAEGSSAAQSTDDLTAEAA